METTDIYLWIMNKSYDFKEIVYSILVGVIGALVLVVFFTSLLSLGTIEKLLPYVIGFNAALTGYNLINRTKSSLKYRRVYAAGSGILMVAITVVLSNIITFYLMGVCLINITELMFLIVIGGVLSGLGGILAIKYLNLD